VPPPAGGLPPPARPVPQPVCGKPPPRPGGRFWPLSPPLPHLPHEFVGEALPAGQVPGGTPGGPPPRPGGRVWPPSPLLPGLPGRWGGRCGGQLLALWSGPRGQTRGLTSSHGLPHLPRGKRGVAAFGLRQGFVPSWTAFLASKNPVAANAALPRMCVCPRVGGRGSTEGRGGVPRKVVRQMRQEREREEEEAFFIAYILAAKHMRQVCGKGGVFAATPLGAPPLWRGFAARRGANILHLPDARVQPVQPGPGVVAHPAGRLEGP